MEGRFLLIWIVAGIAALGAAWTVYTYNRFITLQNAVTEAWSGIDVQLRRRHELAPNLFAVTEAFQHHERTVLTDAVALRSRPVKHQIASPDTAAAEARLGRSLTSMIAVAEAYPQLKSDEVFLRLQDGLTQIENDLQFARRYYNGAVRNLNNALQIFPSSVIARLFAFKAAHFFEVDDPAERLSPEMGTTAC